MFTFKILKVTPSTANSSRHTPKCLQLCLTFSFRTSPEPGGQQQQTGTHERAHKEGGTSAEWLRLKAEHEPWRHWRRHVEKMEKRHVEKMPRERGSTSEGREAREALPGRGRPGLGHTAEARSALERTAKSPDVFLPSRSGWCSQSPSQRGIDSLEF